MLLKYSAGIDEMQRMVWLYKQYMQTDPTIKYLTQIIYNYTG